MDLITYALAKKHTESEVSRIVNRETDSDAMSRQAAVNALGVDKTNLKNRLDEDYNFLLSGLNGKASKISVEGLSVNPESFGLSDSATDNSQAVKDTLNHIKNMLGGKGKINFPQGKTYKFTQVIGDFNLSNIEINLNGSILNFSALPSGSALAYLAFRGTYGEFQPLSSNVTAGTKVITVPSTTGFVVGDMVRIYSNKIYDTQRTSSKIGEIAFINSVDSSTQMTLKTPINFDYSVSDSATVQRLSPVENIYIHNGTIIGTNAYNQHYAIELQVAKNCLVENMKTVNIDKRHYVFTDCVNVNLVNSSMKRAIHETQAYGVSFVDGTVDCICTGCHFEEVRHSLSTNNNVGWSYGIPRRILFSNNTVINSSRNLSNGAGGDAIDTHAGSEEIYIIGNTVHGSSGHGINFEGRSGIIANNHIKYTESVGIYVNPRSDFKSRFVITGNRVIKAGAVSTSNYGISVTLFTAGCESCIISNNEVESQHQALRAVGASSSYPFDRLVIEGNTGEVTVASYGIHVDYANHASIVGNSVKAPDVGLYISNAKNSTVVGNSALLYGSGATSWGVRLNGDTSYTVVSANSLRDAGSGRTSAIGIVFQSTVIYSGAFGNITQGFGTNVNVSTGTGNVAANNI